MTPEERFINIEVQTEKNAAAIRDLIVVSRTIVDAQIRNEAEMKDLHELSRTLVDAQIHSEAEMKELRESQKDTDVRLKALIDAVDKMIRGSQNGKKQ